MAIRAARAASTLLGSYWARATAAHEFKMAPKVRISPGTAACRVAPEAGVEQVGAVGKQAIGKELAAAGVDAVGEFVGAAAQQPRLLQRAVDLALRRGEAAALRRNGGVLDGTCSRRRTELGETVGDQLEAGFERRRMVANLIAQRRQALLERRKPVLGLGSLIETMRDIVELRLECIEIRRSRPLGGKRRGCVWGAAVWGGAVGWTDAGGADGAAGCCATADAPASPSATAISAAWHQWRRLRLGRRSMPRH